MSLITRSVWARVRRLCGTTHQPSSASASATTVHIYYTHLLGPPQVWCIAHELHFNNHTISRDCRLLPPPFCPWQCVFVWMNGTAMTTTERVLCMRCVMRSVLSSSIIFITSYFWFVCGKHTIRVAVNKRPTSHKLGCSRRLTASCANIPTVLVRHIGSITFYNIISFSEWFRESW